MPTDALDITSVLAMATHWCEEMDARVQRRENGETRCCTHEEVVAELDAVIA
jgi:hypothetical protein